jgi:hypothetical protein
MQGKHRLGVGVVFGALVLVGVAAGAKEPQFRSVVIQGTAGGATGEHHLTFSGPVALPGVSLGPGTYIFRRPANNILQVTGRTDQYEVVLGAPLGDGSPRRIEAWFAPGESTGQQLMYKAR